LPLLPVICSLILAHRNKIPWIERMCQGAKSPKIAPKAQLPAIFHTEARRHREEEGRRGAELLFAGLSLNKMKLESKTTIPRTTTLSLFPLHPWRLCVLCVKICQRIAPKAPARELLAQAPLPTLAIQPLVPGRAPYCMPLRVFRISAEIPRA